MANYIEIVEKGDYISSLNAIHPITHFSLSLFSIILIIYLLYLEDVLNKVMREFFKVDKP